jgi:hypothetical protein
MTVLPEMMSMHGMRSEQAAFGTKRLLIFLTLAVGVMVFLYLALGVIKPMRLPYDSKWGLLPFGAGIAATMLSNLLLDKWQKKKLTAGDWGAAVGLGMVTLCIEWTVVVSGM